MNERTLFILLFTGIWCLAGLVFLCVGIGFLRSARRREERQRARAEGVVIEVVRRVSHDRDGSSVSFYPIVEFEADGRRISLESESGGGRKRFYEGQKVQVLYDPDDPACFDLEGYGSRRLLGRISLGSGLVCIAIGTIVALVIGAQR
ncbi:MAG: DUF3592 domain-containing protein [Clostridia bacterium]|nr:DUF3592 domain-containing protein [Clostridia bacterium]